MLKRKGRDDLNAFDEMESMTSELEETDTPPSLEEEKVSLKVIGEFPIDTECPLFFIGFHLY